MIRPINETSFTDEESEMDRNHKARLSNDLLITYVYDLSEYAGRTIPYAMHRGYSGVVIRFDSLFDIKW